MSSDSKYRIFNNSHHCTGTGQKCGLTGVRFSPGRKLNFLKTAISELQKSKKILWPAVECRANEAKVFQKLNTLSAGCFLSSVS